MILIPNGNIWRRFVGGNASVGGKKSLNSYFGEIFIDNFNLVIGHGFTFDYS